VNLPLYSHLSTFPVFPQMSVAGQAIYDLPSGGQQLVKLAKTIYPNTIGLFPLLEGSIDEAEYHLFDTLSVIVVTIPATITLSADSLYDDTVRPIRVELLQSRVYPNTNLTFHLHG
jgi:hypothetical protein